MKRYCLLIAPAIFLTLLLLPPARPNQDKNKFPAEIGRLAEGNNRFALDLYRRLSRQEGNLFLSPFSISTALAMTCAGARGDTEKEMAQTLHFNLPPDRLHPAFSALIGGLRTDFEKSGYEFQIANRLWGQKGYPFLDSFLETIEKFYGAELALLDFKNAAERARRTINAWVEKETAGKIKDLIGPGVLNALTRLVLTNAVYFKADWSRQFKKELTKEAPFHLSSGRDVTVSLMNRKDDFGYLEEEDLQVLELPYANGDLAMVILLPGKASGLAKLERSLTPENLDRWLSALRKREVNVYLPKFKLDSGFDLRSALSALGMSSAFTLGTADFSGMDGKKDLFISAVIHRAFVSVDEEGTEAAAATAVVMTMGLSPDQPPVFRADRSFVFLVRERATGGIIFIGRLEDPGK